MSNEWRTLRCVVEVKVPPGNRSTEKDLVYQVEQALQRGDGNAGVPMPRSHAADRYEARAEVKAWTPVFRYAVNHLPERIRRHIAMSY